MIPRPISGQLVIATHNQGKFEEMVDLMRHLNLTLVSAAQLNLAVPDETEDTFAGNATLKAKAAAKATGLVALADDSGLSIDALGGAPGVHTADWAETPNGRDFEMAMGKVHKALLNTRAAPPWHASFRCALALAWPEGEVVCVEGAIDGQVIWPGRGDGGHGYDPIFQAEGESRTFAEVNRWEKNRYSHRGVAMKRLLDVCFT